MSDIAKARDLLGLSSPLFSQGALAGPFVFVSGIVGIDPDSGSLAGDTIQEQTRQALTNCEQILQAGGASLDDVVEAGILLNNPADFAGFNQEWAAWSPPTRRHGTPPSWAPTCQGSWSRSA